MLRRIFSPKIVGHRGGTGTTTGLWNSIVSAASSTTSRPDTTTVPSMRTTTAVGSSLAIHRHRQHRRHFGALDPRAICYLHEGLFNDQFIAGKTRDLSRYLPENAAAQEAAIAAYDATKQQQRQITTSGTKGGAAPPLPSSSSSSSSPSAAAVQQQHLQQQQHSQPQQQKQQLSATRGALDADGIPAMVSADDLEGVTYVDACVHLGRTFVHMRDVNDDYDTLRRRSPTHFEKLINVSMHERMFKESLQYMDKHDEIYSVFGVHPFYASNYTQSIGERMKSRYLTHPKCVGVGAIGLDFSSRFPPTTHDLQRKAFTYQLNHAVNMKKAVMIHTRYADKATLEIMKNELPASWPIHLCNFVGHVEFLSEIFTHFSFAYVGVTGILTHTGTPSCRVLEDLVVKVPLERLLLESNAPYMTPDPYRGDPCHMGHVPLVADRIAKLKGVHVREVYKQCRQNVRDVYGI